MEESKDLMKKLKEDLHRPMEFGTPRTLEEIPEGWSKERDDLLDKIQKKNEAEIMGVQEMLKHPFTPEPARKQVEERNK